MQLSEIINSDTLKMTLIPGILVLLVLFFWFKRSGPKESKLRQRRIQRSPYYDDIYDDSDISEDNVSLGASQDLDQLGEQILNQTSHHNVVAKDEPANIKDKQWQNKLAAAEQLDNVIEPADEILFEPVIHEDALATQDEQQGNIDNELKKGLILVLNVVAGGRPLRGSQILKAITATGMSYGDMGIFHYYMPNRANNRPLFSIANMVEPGSFNLNTMEELATPGLTLFANITRPEDGLNTFDIMYETAKQLASGLGATVCDERRGTLSKQGVEHIHGQIVEHRRRSRLGNSVHA